MIIFYVKMIIFYVKMIIFYVKNVIYSFLKRPPRIFVPPVLNPPVLNEPDIPKPDNNSGLFFTNPATGFATFET